MSIQDHDSHKVDSISGTTTTGHSWDGIEELNTPLPKWWLTILYASIIWAIGYVIVYPAIPLVSSFTQGAFGWSSRAAVEADLAELVQQRAPVVAALSKASITEIEKDPKLLAFARASGRVTFGDNCAPCHGAGGGGAKSYPNLNDDDWLWGGSAEQIYETIAYGIRSGHPKAHEGNMPAFGRDGLLKPAEISQVADYVRALSGLSTATGYDKAIGAKVFAENCAACHGDEGKGNQELGAPNLTDQIWLYGSDKATISEGIINGRGNVMPAWVGRLDETTIKALTVYVHTLGGGR
jgi:cytochrome c oxidase cbb3-type subunit 3